jgi:putative iron-dependent peroxidase
MMQHGAWDRVPIDAQSVAAPLSRSAVFLVMAAGAGDADLARVRDVLGGVGDLVKNVGFRDLGGRLSCIVGIGSALWDRLSPARRPAELRALAPIQGPVSAPRAALSPLRSCAVGGGMPAQPRWCLHVASVTRGAGGL